MRAIDRARVSRAGRVHHVVGGVERKGDITRNPEDSITTAENRLASKAIGKPNPRSEVVFVQWHVVACLERNQKYVSENRQGTGWHKLVEIALRGGIEIGQPVVALRPWALKFVTKTQVQSKGTAEVPSVIEIHSPINLLARRERPHTRLGKKMILEVAEVIRISE